MNNRPVKVGFISLFSDTGHVIPLLRMASSFAESGYEVIIYLPEENRGLGTQYGFEIKSFGKVSENINKDFYLELSKKSLFYNSFSNYTDINRNFTYPLIVNLCKRMNTIKNLVEQDAPDLLIADNFIFNDYLRCLAAQINSPLVLHYANGNYRFYQSHFVSQYGFGFPDFLSRRILAEGYKLKEYFEFQTKNENNYYMSLFRQSVKETFPGIGIEKVSPILIASGLSYVESKKSGMEVDPHEQYKLFPPLKDSRKMTIEPALKNWLDESPDRPLVYVCLGTVVKGNKKIFKSILDGLKSLKIKVLWAAPEDQLQILRDIGLPSNFRIEPFVPQPQILNLDAVKCFVTHGGAGGVQEAMLAGKPMLCIPFMHDQPFNSSVVERIGIGIKIWKQLVNPWTVKSSIRKILKNKKYINHALDLKNELIRLNGGIEIMNYLKGINLI